MTARIPDDEMDSIVGAAFGTVTDEAVRYCRAVEWRASEAIGEIAQDDFAGMLARSRAVTAGSMGLLPNPLGLSLERLSNLRAAIMAAVVRHARPATSPGFPIGRVVGRID